MLVLKLFELEALISVGLVRSTNIYFSTINTVDIEKTPQPGNCLVKEFDSCKVFPHEVQPMSKAVVNTSSSTTRLP